MVGIFKKFLKKIAIGSLAVATLFFISNKSKANSETAFYNYLDKGQYSFQDKEGYAYKDTYMEKRYKAADKDRYTYLDKGMYEFSDVFRQRIYEEHYRRQGLQMPTNNIMQSNYFRNLLGYEYPYNYDMNFYLSRELFELSKMPENRRAFNELYRWQERKREGLNAPVDDRTKDSLPITLKPHTVSGIKKIKKQEKETEEPEKSEKKFFLYTDPNFVLVLKSDPNSLSHSDIMRLRNYEGSVLREYLKK